MPQIKQSLKEFISIAKKERRAEKRKERQSEKPPTEVTLKKPVFYTSAVLLTVFTAWTLMDPQYAGDIIGKAVVVVGRWFGPYYILLATAIIVFVLVLAVSKYGNLRLGPDDSRPQFSTFSWAAMLFAAGIGTDIMFFSVAEPITQYISPPEGKPETVESARQAVVWTLFHYGLTGWGMYALMGLALAYFAYRRKRPLSVRSALYPLLGRRVNGAFGDTVDAAAIVSTIFGVAVTLGIGVVQLNYGLYLMFGLPEHKAVQFALILIAIVMATVSATTGVERGIRFLSQLNVILAILLVVWIVVTGDTVFYMNALVMNVGDLLARFPSMTMDTMAYLHADEWKNAWTLFFWAWWVAWASFIGLFLARISRGRKIREFVFGCLVFPFLYVVLWISVFGNAAIKAVRSGNHKLVDVTMEAPAHGFYMLLQNYPLPMFLVGLSTVVGLLFYVTSADSAALVMANLSSNLPTPMHDAKKPSRIFWAVITGLLTFGILLAGGIPALQNATIIMGLPFSVVLVLVMFGLAKSIKEERRSGDVHAKSLLNIRHGRPAGTARASNWQDRLWKALNWVTIDQARREMDDVVIKAMDNVAQELGHRGLDAAVMGREEGLAYLRMDDDSPGVTVHDRTFLVVKDDVEPFYYMVSIVEVAGVAYMGFVGHAGDVTVRLEVSATGSDNNYDIVGYSVDQVIDDIVTQFERYIEYRWLVEEDIPEKPVPKLNQK